MDPFDSILKGSLLRSKMGVNKYTTNYLFSDFTGEWYYINEHVMKRVKGKERNRKRSIKQGQSIKKSWKDTLLDISKDISMDTIIHPPRDFLFTALDLQEAKGKH